MAYEALQSIGDNGFKLAVFKDINNYTVPFVEQVPNISDLLLKRGTDLTPILLEMADGETRRLVEFPRGAYLQLKRNAVTTSSSGRILATVELILYYTSGKIMTKLIQQANVNLGNTYNSNDVFYYPIYVLIAFSGTNAHMRAIWYDTNDMTSKCNFVQVATDASMYTYLSSGQFTFYDPDAYGDLGYSDIGGGNGTFDFTSDEILPVDVPTFDVIDSGFIQIYKAEIPQIRQLASYLWTTDFFDNIVKITQDPIDVIMSLCVFPFEISGENPRNVQAGNIKTPVVMSIPTRQFIDIDCGTVEIKNFYGSYLDYSPYTKCELFLPYCGVHEISLDDIMGKAVSIKYRVDLLSGACNIFVIVNNNVLYNFSGSCGVSVPITSQSFTEMYGTIMNMALSGGQALSNGVGGIGNFASTIAGGVMQCKPSFARSGNCGGNIGFAGIQKPYFIFTVPRSAIPKNQNTFIGYPILATYNLDSLKGFTVIEEIHFKGTDGMTEEEINETVRLLKEGVIL